MEVTDDMGRPVPLKEEYYYLSFPGDGDIPMPSMQSHMRKHQIWSGGRRSKGKPELTKISMGKTRQVRVNSLVLASLNNFGRPWASELFLGV